MEWVGRNGGSILPCKSPSYAVFKARERTGGRTDQPARPAASAVACGIRPEGMLPGPRPTLGPLPSFLLQLSPAACVPENSGRISSQEGDTAVRFLSPGSFRHQGARLHFSLTMGLALSSAMKVCMQLCTSGFVAGPRSSAVLTPETRSPVPSLAPGAGLQRLLPGSGFCSQLHYWLVVPVSHGGPYKRS